MITVNWNEVMTAKVLRLPNPCVYVMTNGEDEIFYVGKSEGVLDRLLSHIGEVRYNTFNQDRLSGAGKYVMRNMPDSLTWQIVIHDGGDCRKITSEGMPDVAENFPQMPALGWVIHAEIVLIRTINPAFNTQYRTGEGATEHLLPSPSGDSSALYLGV